MVRYLNADQKAQVALMFEAFIPLPEIAQTVGVSLRHVQRLKRLYDATGTIFHQTMTPFNGTVLTPGIMEELVKHLLEKPDLYLDEMQWFLAEEHGVYASISAISRRLKKEGWNKKKLRQRAVQQSEELRLDWARKIGPFTAEMFVFCDESGTDRRDGMRRTGWAPKGAEPSQSGVFERGKRFHLLPAITSEGILDLLVFKGQTDKEGFIAWLEQAVFPKMNAFPAANSILVMDNASWHHDARVLELAKKHGVLVWYLPPYSPDFNPIEAFFHDLKAYIRRQYRYHGGDGMTEAEFKEFLYNAAHDVGGRAGAFHGHYRAACLVFRDPEEGDNGVVDYNVLYAGQLREFQETGTVV